MAVGIPTKTSHGGALDAILREFDVWLLTLYRTANDNRLTMASAAVSDLVIKNIWDIFADGESRINEIRRTPDFHDAYARYRGLSYSFNCTDDVNAATEKIINLPVNHKFKTNHRVDFKLIQGALTGGLAEGTNYFVRTVDTANGTITLTTAEDGATDINLSNAVGTAEMVLNIKPDLVSLRTAIDAALDEIELNLTQRASTYNRANLEHDYSTRSTTETTTLRSKLLDVENLIDTTPA